MPSPRPTSLGPDALVVTSAIWQTNAVALRVGEAVVLVDSVLLPHELDALPDLLSGAGLEPQALVATHAHFDHLLSTVAYPRLPLLVGEQTLHVLHADPAGPLLELRESDAEMMLVRDRLPTLGQVQEAPQHGELRLGDGVLEVVPADGHAADGIALFDPAQRLLVPGDYLCAVEIPLVSEAGSPERFLATLDRLAPLVERAELIVPGHGPPLTRRRASELLDVDRRYVEALATDPRSAEQLRGPYDHRQSRIHTDNVRKHAREG
jgi:glyoxylase-like metal-dependent hydrolase (beta-lactamase superfamily II)